LKAIAEHGLGRERDAVWHWHMAQALDSSVVGRASAKYPAHGTFLQENLLVDPDALPNTRTVGDDPKVVPPRATKTVKPSYPRAASHFGVEGLLVVGSVIGTDGLVYYPKILKPLPAATLTVAALESWTSPNLVH
jgi:outer membrane biosynthesis protein TonB